MNLISAVDIGESLNEAFRQFFGFLPNLLGFLAILVIGYFIAKAVKGILAKVLEKVGVDKALHSGQAGQYVEKISPGASPARLIAALGFWTIMVFVLTAAIGVLQIPAVTQFMNQVLAYLPRVIAAVLIFVAGGAIAGAVGGLAHKAMGDTPTGRIVRAVAPTLILAITMFMVLNQLQIAPAIVQITYTALIGGTALALALAFGLGGREVAGRLVDDAYGKAQDEKDTVKRDMQVGKERAKDQGEQAQTQVQGGGSGGEQGGGGRFQQGAPSSPGTVPSAPAVGGEPPAAGGGTTPPQYR